MDKQVKLYAFILVHLFTIISYSSGVNSSSKLRKSDRSFPNTGLESTPSKYTNRSKKKWISEIFAEARASFDMGANVTPGCKNDFELYKLHLDNQTVWAVRMLESSQWPLVGLFAGMTHHMGNYDECLRVSAYGIKGKYCLVEATYKFTHNNTLDEDSFHLMDWPNEEYSAWTILQKYEHDPVRVNRRTISWALCIPSSCRSNDLKVSLNHSLLPLFRKYDFDISVDVNPILCQIEKKNEYTVGFYVTGLIFFSVIFVVIVATIYDIRNGKTSQSTPGKESWREIFCFFSLRRNYKIYTTFSPETSYPLVHLLKIIAAVFVLTGHRMFIFYCFPTFNLEQHEMMTYGKNFELLQTNVVDIFFTISGYLMFHYCFVHVQKNGFRYLIFYWIFRWLRMMFVPLLLILNIIFIAPSYSFGGPLYDYYASKETKYCESNWWITLLAINNIVQPDRQCLPQTWYLSADLQLTIIGGVLLYVVTKNHKIGIMLTTLTLALSAAVTYTVAYKRHYDGILLLTINNIIDIRNVERYYAFYCATYVRTGPYLLGCLAALTTKFLKEKKYKFSSTTKTVILTTTFVLGMGFNSYGFVFYKTAGRPYDPVENGIFAALARSLFALPFACLLCIYFTSGLGSMDEILNNKMYAVFGHLVYCAYLIGFFIQGPLTFTQRTYMPVVGKITMYWMATADIVWTFAAAFVTHLTVEMPFSNLLKLLQRALITHNVKKLNE